MSVAMYPGADSVDLGAELRPFRGHRPGEVDDRPLGGAVRTEPWPTEEPEDRSHVHRTSTSTFREVATGLASAEEHASDIGVEDALPLVFAEVDQIGLAGDAGIVHQDVDAAEFSKTRCEQCPDRLGIRHVSGHRDGRSAFLDDLRFYVAQVTGGASRQDNLHTRASEVKGDRTAESATRSGNNCDLRRRHDDNMSDIFPSVKDVVARPLSEARALIL